MLKKRAWYAVLFTIVGTGALVATLNPGEAPEPVEAKSPPAPQQVRVAKIGAIAGHDPWLSGDRVKAPGAGMPHAGVLGAYNTPSSPFGADQALGQDPMSALGALMGDQGGSESAFGRLSARGTGRVGFTGGGTIGLGNIGTIGHGAGGGSGYGSGSGSGYGSGSSFRGRSARPSGPLAMQRSQSAASNREGYDHNPEAEFFDVSDRALSTFSVDVDTASYANVRRFLNSGQLPPPDAVRVEEMLNYFDYAYGDPGTDSPFALHTEVSDCPWNPQHRLVHLGLKTGAIDQDKTPKRNLVFLIDVSGSMAAPDKLPLLKQGMAMLTKTLRPKDRVSMVVYAGASGLVLPPTSGRRKKRIMAALSRLRPGGSTHGAAGIQLAYQMAQKHFMKGAVNRVILATDGDFNVGPSSQGELARLIERKRKTGIFLTVLGFGRGNLQDAQMEALADKGNGNYAYIDSAAEAHKVLVREAGSTLVTVARDVKLQVEFNPARVRSYRLIGYENRTLAARDFNDDEKDAGEVGAGHTVTALYEVVPADGEQRKPGVDRLRYRQVAALSPAAETGELLTLKVRYKAPQGRRSLLIQRRVMDHHRPLARSSRAFRFSTAVAGFGLLLRKSKHAADAHIDELHALARGALGPDAHGDRAGLLSLMAAARTLGVDG